MAAPNRRQRGSLANLLGDVIDDTKDFVDDALDRAGNLERDVRRGARRVLHEDAPADREPAKSEQPKAAESADELDSLRAALEELTAKVDRLARLRDQNDKPTR